MIRIQNLHASASVVRFYAEDDPSPMADFQAVCTLEWESPTVVWVHGLKGVSSRMLLREFVEELAARGVTVIRARRVEGRRLPRAQVQIDGTYLMHIADLI